MAERVQRRAAQMDDNELEAAIRASLLMEDAGLIQEDTGEGIGDSDEEGSLPSFGCSRPLSACTRSSRVSYVPGIDDSQLDPDDPDLAAALRASLQVEEEEVPYTGTPRPYWYALHALFASDGLVGGENALTLDVLGLQVTDAELVAALRASLEAMPASPVVGPPTVPQVPSSRT